MLARPDLSARVSDIDHAGAVLVVETDPVDDAPILDLRVRKAARRNGTKVVTLTSRPSALDRVAEVSVHFAPGAAEAALTALAAELRSTRASAEEPAGAPPEDEGSEGGLLEKAKEVVSDVAEKVGVTSGPPAGGLDAATLADRAGADPEVIRAAVEILGGAGDVVVLWGERLSHGARGPQAVDALLAVAAALGRGRARGVGHDRGAAGTNSRGLREVGVLPGVGPGLQDSPEAGMGRPEIARALEGAI